MFASNSLVSMVLPIGLALCGGDDAEELPSRTIPASRTSTAWVTIPGGAQVAVDEGLSFRGTTVHLSLTDQLLAVDEKSGNVRWCVDTSAYWNRLAIVRSDPGRSWVGLAVELTRTDDDAGRRVLFDLRTGGTIETPGAERPAGLPLEPRSATGDDLVVPERFERLIVTEAEWRALVAETLGPERVAPLGEIDFATESVWVLAAGRRVNHDGYRVVEAFDGEGRVLVRLEDSSFQTMGGGVDTDPWLAVAVPRPSPGERREPTELVVERDVQSLIGGPRVWKELWRGALPDRSP